MTAIPIVRSQYWNPSLGTVRAGTTAHGESLVDVESGLLPLARATASSLHTWGVTDGLTVSAVTSASGVTVAPGTGLDSLGRLIVLADGGVAIIDPAADPHQVLNVATVAVGPDGVQLPTAGTAAGPWLVTLTFHEVQDQGQLSSAPVLLLAPWVRLQASADVPNDGRQLVLATVTLDAGGLVTALDATGRRLSGLPTARLELRRPAAGGATLSATQQAGAVLAVPDGGGLSLTATAAGLDVPVLTVDGAVQTLALLPGGGRASLGVSVPAPDIGLHVEGAAVHSGGSGAGLSFADQGAASFVSAPANGERWLWYSQGGTARLWSGSDMLTVAPASYQVALDVARRMRVRQGGTPSAGIWFTQDQGGDRGFVGMASDTQIGLWGAAGLGWGLTMDVASGTLRWAGTDVGRPDGPSTLSLWGSRIGDVGNGILFLRSGGSVVAFDSPNNLVGIGTASPDAKLAVVNAGIAISANNTQDSTSFIPGMGILSIGQIAVLATGRTTGVYASGKTYGVVGSGATAGQFYGNVSITGSLSKGGGGFRIDHPLDPANRYLSHSFVESPEMLNAYRGTVTTGADGAATVDLPDYVDALNADFTYHLTVLGEPAAVGVTEPLRGNRFQLRAGRPGAEVCWLLLGARQDPWARAHRIQVEEDKPDHARDRFLHPEAYGNGPRAYEHADHEAIAAYAATASG